jgi:C-terminal processing protease CtpA/Prc
MKKIIFLFILLNGVTKAQTNTKFNLDFENYKSTEDLAEGWFKWGHYDLKIDTIASTGKYSGKIIADAKGSSFGSISYKIPANYKGKSITLEGYMKIENVTNFAGLLLRIDGEGGSLAFDNMQKQNVNGTKDWQKYSITLPYSNEAKNIFVAGILQGKGTAWFDNFTLKIDGKDVQTLKEQEKPIFKADLDTTFNNGSEIVFPKLNEELITNLELLGRIWGFMKYYHPSIAKGDYNWDYELFRILPNYLKVVSTAERDQLLTDWINNYGTLKKCKKCKPSTKDAFFAPDLKWITNKNLSPQLTEQLNSIYKNRHLGKSFYITLNIGVLNPNFLNEKGYTNMPYPDAGFRLLSVFKYWNMIQYFFPYKHLTDKNWSEVLKEYIPKFILAKNELDYEVAALQLIGEVNDTHANLWGGNNKINEEKGDNYSPFRVQFIENLLVVTDYFNPEIQQKAELKIGDIITHINSKPTKNLVDSLSDYYPVSNNAALLRDIAEDILRSPKKLLNISYTSENIQKEKQLMLYPKDSLNYYRWYRKDNEKCYKLLNDSIGYITLKSIQQEDIQLIKDQFKDTKGIIIDIRNYPSTFVPFSLGSYFISSAIPFVKFTKNNLNNIGEFTFTEPIKITKLPSKTYQGKLIVIVNEYSQSQAEYTAMAFRAGDNTTIIGSTTAGADGNVSSISLPGGLQTMISGIGVYYPDGTETQRIGIVPDIEVKPTIDGIKNGKDEVLEKAIELINN